MTDIQSETLKPDANTNLMCQRTLIPTIKLKATPSSQTVTFGSAVFALSRTTDREKRYAGLDIARLWNDVPVVWPTGRMNDEQGNHYIVLG